MRLIRFGFASPVIELSLLWIKGNLVASVRSRMRSTLRYHISMPHWWKDTCLAAAKGSGERKRVVSVMCKQLVDCQNIEKHVLEFPNRINRDEHAGLSDAHQMNQRRRNVRIDRMNGEWSRKEKRHPFNIQSRPQSILWTFSFISFSFSVDSNHALIKLIEFTLHANVGVGENVNWKHMMMAPWPPSICFAKF